MNTTKESGQVTSFLKLKNDKGDDIYSIDRLNHALIVSPMKRNINIFDTLTLCSEDNDNVCKLNMSEIFINALYDALERNELYGDAKVFERIMGNNPDIEGVTNTFLKSKIAFREYHECFPNYTDWYVQPESKSTLNELYRAEDMIREANEAMQRDLRGEQKPHVNNIPKIGPYEPCPCGSGEKYKFCCCRKER